MADQNILAHFTSGGSPATGLSPTIRVRDVDLGSLVVTDASMTEVGDGAYTYDFTGYDSQKDYSVRCDGGATLSGSERYTFGGNDSYVDDVWDEDLSGHSAAGTAGDAQMRAIYHEMVHIDTVSGTVGTIYPLGTGGSPVNNIANALTIADSFGFKDFGIKGTLVLTPGYDLSEYNFSGHSSVLNNIIVLAGATVTKSKFSDVTLTGQIVGSDIHCSKCMISNLSNADGTFFDSAFSDTITVASGGSVLGKAMSLASEPTIVDFNNNPGNFAVGAESGRIKIVNASAAGTTVRYAAYAGTIQVDSTCTSGTAAFIGSGQIVDDSGPDFIVDHTGLIAIPTIAEAVWGVPLAQYNEVDSAGTALMDSVYDGRVNINTVSGTSGTTYPHGTPRYPVNTLDDALTIANTRNINTLILETSITVEATHDISSLAVETIGIMGTTITFEPDCSTNYAAFRYANLEGQLTSGDQVLVENCSILNLENFTGIMNNVAFGQGSEVSIGSWATIILGTAGGEPTNEVEMAIGTSSLNISNWTGNLKLKNKTGDNRSVINCSSGNIIIDSTCVSGTIQLLGIGEVEADNSGPNCNVDTDGFISRTSIAEAVWDEPLVDHANDETTGFALLQESYDNEVYIDIINGQAGTVYPTGIRQHPVNSITDALTIATTYGLSTIHVLGSLTLSAGEDVSGYTFHSDRSLGNNVVIDNAITDYTYFSDLTVSGTMNGYVRFTYCVLGQLNNIKGGIKNSLVTDDISFVPNGNNYMTDCDRFISDETYVDIDIADSNFNMIRGRGNYRITGKTSTNVTSLDLNGSIIVDSTCVSGTIVIAGLTRIIDESGPNCFVLEAALTNSSITDAVWDEVLADHVQAGTYGAELATKADIAASSSTDTSSAASGSVIYGLEDGGTYASTIVKDNVYWIIEENATNGITIELVFNIPDDNRAGVFRVFGRYEGTPGLTHYQELWVYNYEASAWEQLIETFMPGGFTSDAEYTHEYFERNIDRTNSNEVKLRIIHNVTSYNANHHLYLDLAEVTSIDVVTAIDTAIAVWDRDLSLHSTAGSAGKIVSDLETYTIRALGLMQENYYLDNNTYETYNGAKLLTGARIRIYSQASSVGTVNDVVATYNIVADWTNDELEYYKVVKT